ncbi:hypothetical protein M105_4071 [Bacteroides fragilis str. 1009-4-F |nr:hypothetical protein M106_2531 [Bacteroides fragilis str. 1009-4-F \
MDILSYFGSLIKKGGGTVASEPANGHPPFSKIYLSRLKEKIL